MCEIQKKCEIQIKLKSILFIYIYALKHSFPFYLFRPFLLFIGHRGSLGIQWQFWFGFWMRSVKNVRTDAIVTKLVFSLLEWAGGWFMVFSKEINLHVYKIFLELGPL